MPEMKFVYIFSRNKKNNYKLSRYDSYINFAKKILNKNLFALFYLNK